MKLAEIQHQRRCNRTSTALDHLVASCLETQEAHPRVCRTHSPLSWVQEFGTVRLKTARRAGHTTAIAQLVTSYHVKGMRTLIVAPFIEQADFLKRDLRVPGDVVSAKSLRVFRGRRYDLIVVDGAFSLHPDEKENIERMAAEQAALAVNYDPPQFCIAWVG